MDLTDEQWQLLEPLIPKPPRRSDGRGRPWRDTREVLNGILWVLRTGAPWKDTGTNALRCLALSNRGGVYEGDLIVLDGGALQLDLKGYEGDRVVSHVARFDFEQDGTLRHRLWSLKGTERTLMLDVHALPHLRRERQPR